MKQAAVKQEPERGPKAEEVPGPQLIADPKGTAVNLARLLQSPQTVWRDIAKRPEHTEPSPLSWPQPTLKETGGGEQAEDVPTRAE